MSSIRSLCSCCGAHWVGAWGDTSRSWRIAADEAIDDTNLSFNTLARGEKCGSFLASRSARRGGATSARPGRSNCVWPVKSFQGRAVVLGDAQPGRGTPSHCHIPTTAYLVQRNALGIDEKGAGILIRPLRRAARLWCTLNSRATLRSTSPGPAGNLPPDAAHEGTGPCQEFRWVSRIWDSGVVLEGSARRKGTGATLAEPSEGLGVDSGDERHILARNDAVGSSGPHLAPGTQAAGAAARRAVSLCGGGGQGDAAVLRTL